MAISMADYQINPKDLSAIHRQMNKSLMVAWINHDLVNRAHNDVDRSFIFYDEHKDFVFAMTLMVGDEAWEMLLNGTEIRYWSRGIR